MANKLHILAFVSFTHIYYICTHIFDIYICFSINYSTKVNYWLAFSEQLIEIFGLFLSRIL